VVVRRVVVALLEVVAHLGVIGLLVVAVTRIGRRLIVRVRIVRIDLLIRVVVRLVVVALLGVIVPRVVAVTRIVRRLIVRVRIVRIVRVRIGRIVRLRLVVIVLRVVANIQIGRVHRAEALARGRIGRPQTAPVLIDQAPIGQVPLGTVVRAVALIGPVPRVRVVKRPWSRASSAARVALKLAIRNCLTTSCRLI